MKYVSAAVAVCMAFGQPAMAAQLTGFTQVNVAGQYDVEVTDGAAFTVDITGPDAAEIRAEVRDRVLRIESTRRSWRGDFRRVNVRVRVTMPRVQGLAASRGVSLKATGIDAQNMALAANTGGQIDIDGTCTNLAVSVSTGGIINGEQFRCDEASASANTGGIARIFADDGLSASASTGGIINVGGSPSVRGRSTTLGGEVRVR